MDQVASDDRGRVPSGVHGGRVEEEDRDSIAGEALEQGVHHHVGGGFPGTGAEGAGGRPLDEEEGVAVRVAEPGQFFGEQAVPPLDEEVLGELGQVCLALDAAATLFPLQSVVACGEAGGAGVEPDDLGVGDPGGRGVVDGEVGGEDEGCLLPIVDEDEDVALQRCRPGFEPGLPGSQPRVLNRYTTDTGKMRAGFEPATCPLGKGCSVRAELPHRNTRRLLRKPAGRLGGPSQCVPL